MLKQLKGLVTFITYGILFLLLYPLVLQGQEQKKVALVIGAQNYVAVAPLRHSLSDAIDLSASLKAKGFQVETLTDPKTKREIRDAITRYYKAMENQTGAVGIIYYAGHGIQYEGENYLIPILADIQNPGDLEDQCIKMNTVMAVLRSASNSLNILLLDACRSGFSSFSRSTDQGLTRIDAPQGSIVVFATQPGKVASDGTGSNGLFTSKLLKHINNPDLNIGDVFKRVKQDVFLESNKTQLPSVEDNSIGGDFYFSGSGNTPIPVYVTPVINKEEPSGNALELNNKGIEFYNQKDYVKAIDYYRKSAALGNAYGQSNLGCMYRDGTGTTQDYAEAIKWFHKAAAQDNASGQANLGWMYENGKGVDKNITEATKWYEKSASQGYEYAKGRLKALTAIDQASDLVNKGDEFYSQKNYPLAFEYYKKAADRNNSYGQSNLGCMYRDGLGIAQNDFEAMRWFLKAASQGNAFGQANLGGMYRDSLGVKQDYVEAIKWYRKAAEQENVDGQTNLGYLYEYGYGVEKNISEAIKWYEKAGNQGSGYAQNNLGDKYRDGLEIKQDYIEAIKWYRKAAEQENVNSQTNLGYLYESGYGVEKSISEAIKWYEKAGNQGSEYAKKRLKILRGE